MESGGGGRNGGRDVDNENERLCGEGVVVLGANAGREGVMVDGFETAVEVWRMRTSD